MPSKFNLIELQERAHRLVYRAVLAGELASLSRAVIPCVDCGSRAQVYEHRDYNQPLEVEPVCRRCNKKRGAAEGHSLTIARDEYQQRRLKRLAVEWEILER